MSTILMTGATAGIGLAAAVRLAADGHDLVLHGRDAERLDRARSEVEAARAGAVSAVLVAALDDLAAARGLADEAAALSVDTVVNNAGVFRTDSPVTASGLDARFVVNTLAPYVIARRLLPGLPAAGRVVNVSSAAQAPVDLDALAGRGGPLDASAAYAQSKLALTMWTRHVADEIGGRGPVVVSVNPASLLGTRMVKEAFGIDGKDVGIGADILARAAVSEEFAQAGGRYYDNDAGRFGTPHPDAEDPARNSALVAVVDELVAAYVG